MRSTPFLLAAVVLGAVVGRTAVSFQEPRPPLRAPSRDAPVFPPYRGGDLHPDPPPPGIVDLVPPQRRLLSGLDPDVVDGVTVRFQPGQCASADGRFLMCVEQPIEVDLRRLGLAGRAEREFGTGGVYFYVVGNSRTGETSIRASQSIRYETTLLPRGWDLMRKLPFALCYDPEWGGLPAMHCAGWPGRPTVLLTLSGSGFPWTAFAGNTRDEWQSIDLAPWIPDNARVAELMFEVRYTGGRAGSAFVRSTGAGTPRIVGTGAPNSSHGLCQFPIRVDSRRQLQVQTLGDVELRIHVIGYEMTEPS